MASVTSPIPSEDQKTLGKHPRDNEPVIYNEAPAQQIPVASAPPQADQLPAASALVALAQPEQKRAQPFIVRRAQHVPPIRILPQVSQVRPVPPVRRVPPVLSGQPVPPVPPVLSGQPVPPVPPIEPVRQAQNAFPSVKRVALDDRVKNKLSTMMNRVEPIMMGPPFMHDLRRIKDAIPPEQQEAHKHIDAFITKITNVFGETSRFVTKFTVPTTMKYTASLEAFQGNALAFMRVCATERAAIDEAIKRLDQMRDEYSRDLECLARLLDM